MDSLSSGVLDFLIMDRKGKLFETLQTEICYLKKKIVFTFLTLKQGLGDLC